MTEELRTVYKWVSRTDWYGNPLPKGLYSLVANVAWQLRYSEQKFITPGIGKIFAFKTLKYALDWRMGTHDDPEDIQLWRAVSHGAKDAITMARMEQWLWHDFWSLYQYEPSRGEKVWPGTVYCDDLKLVERLDWPELKRELDRKI